MIVARNVVVLLREITEIVQNAVMILLKQAKLKRKINKLN
jgi:hypothetical protein